MIQSDPFAELLKQSDSLDTFSPCAHYDRDGDCIEFFLSNEPFYAIRVSHCITVYYSEKTSEVVGGQIKAILEKSTAPTLKT